MCAFPDLAFAGGGGGGGGSTAVTVSAPSIFVMLILQFLILGVAFCRRR